MVFFISGCGGSGSNNGSNSAGSNPAGSNSDASVTWQHVGGPGGGNSDITSLAIDPTNSQTIYAGTASGGLFKSTDGGVSWNLLGSGLTATSIRSLALDPATPLTVYAGTMDGVVPTNSNLAGGVFKTTDGGLTWTSLSSGLLGSFVESVVLAPSDSQTVYAGTTIPNYLARGGWSANVFRSTDGGLSWNIASSGLTGTVVYTLGVDPSNSRTLYAGTGSNFYSGTVSGIFKSINGGSSWTLSLGTSVDVHSIAIDPKNGQNVYVGTASGMLKSTDGGASWGGIGGGQIKAPVQALAVDPANSSTIYAGTTQGAFKSKDGGNSWTGLTIGLGTANVNALVVDPPSRRIFLGTNGGGVFKSYTSVSK